MPLESSTLKSKKSAVASLNFWLKRQAFSHVHMVVVVVVVVGVVVVLKNQYSRYDSPFFANRIVAYFLAFVTHSLCPLAVVFIMVFVCYRPFL